MPICASCGHENSEHAKFCEECGAPLAAVSAAREQRKTVTVVFCDVTGSTALGESSDPEALRAVLARFFERMRAIVEAHGGSVEKFIGDAVMAVFGVPQVHEDDALRAVRAALEMRDALPELGVRARIGVNTGEVVTGTEERLATGDAVNVAARLEQAAEPGEVLVGEATLALVRDAVESEPVDSLHLKGKAEPVSAFRLLALGGGPSRRHGAPMVGRVRELDRLRDAFGQAVADHSCQLFTILGTAGVGKSRLVYEFLLGPEATVVRGRCLSYGEGISYWPVLEVLHELDTLPSDPAAAASLRSLLGETEQATSAEEIAWAFRKLLEERAQERPLVCVFDDLHWAEETLLDLVEHVADLSRGAPLLLLCLARPELLDRRPGWGGGKLNATTVLLEPLSPDETDVLLAELGAVEGELKVKILQAAEGNPLFLEEMLELVREAKDGEITVPPTIQALLAARLDQLEASERGVLERGSVEGRVFHQGAVHALAPEEAELGQRLVSLVRKELVRPDTPQLPGEDAFRFRHLLIRDAAYDALPKATRAVLHQRFAAWLEEHGQELPELEEILGYHLEQAVRYRRELGEQVDPELAEAARSHLAAAGRRARARGDQGAAVKLLERAAALLPEGEIELGLESDLLEALFWSGRGEEALGRAASLAERAVTAGDRVGELSALLLTGRYRLSLEPEGATDELEALVERALPVLEAAGNDLALSLAYRALGEVKNMRAQMDAALAAYERAAAHAQRASLPGEFVTGGAFFRLYGTTPVSELVVWLDEQEDGAAHPDQAQVRARALARLGRIEDARTVLAQSCAELEERGARLNLAGALGHETVELEVLAGDAVAAVAAGEHGCRLYEELGERALLSTAAGMLARACVAAGRLEEADAWAGRAAELGASDDVTTQMLWRQARALVLARRGRAEAAQALSREAVAIAEGTDFLDAQGDAYSDLADVLVLAGRSEEAAVALEQALTRYERKENLVMASRSRERLQAIREQAQA